MQIIYVEKAIQNHPRVEAILARFPQHQLILCDHYGEVFNPKNQNFRQQKKHPSLILAEKKGKKVLPTPEGFGIGGEQNYYFSHMLNCLYDCRYCFLQGMYPSAHYVLFINYEDFMTDIAELTKTTQQKAYFFSGYDGDSLAYEPVSGFLHTFLPFFRQQSNAILELRTKSVNIRELMNQTPFEHCVVAFSFTPDIISTAVEHKVPSVKKRLAAMKSLAQHGWKIGLRFDPLIYADNFQQLYQQLIDDVFCHITSKQLHSISIGPMRFPEKMFQKLITLYPHDTLLAHPLVRRNKQVTYTDETEQQMKQIVLQLLRNHCDASLIFECRSI